MAEDRHEYTHGRPVLIHVGYHKAASTWLQQVLFSDPGLRFRLPFVRSEVNDRIVAPKQLLFAAASERAFFERGLEQALEDVAREDAAGGEASVSVISNERFSGNPHSGGWDSRILADRLALLFPGARVLIVIREQRSAIFSTYLQYVREGGVEALERYLAPPTAGKFRRPLFDLDFFAYHALIDYYQHLFGRERVLVLPYELLHEDALAFAARICSFAGVAPPTTLPERRPNAGLSPLAAALKRPINRWFVRDSLNPSAPLPFENANLWLNRAFTALDRRLPETLRHSREETLRQRIAATTDDYYHESNSKTAQLTGLDLASLGYE